MQDRIPSLQDMAYKALVKQGLFGLGSRLVERLIIEKLIPDFLQAVVDDNKDKVRALLGSNPELLLIDIPDDIVVESKHTLQKFYAEDALAMAVKRKQINMTELLLSYYDKLEQSSEILLCCDDNPAEETQQKLLEQQIETIKQKRANALSCWSPYEMQKNADDEDEIVIPQEYADYAQSLINVFARETFPNGVDGELSEDTESAWSFLLNNMLLPESAVKLDNYLDTELFLLALYKAYRDSFDTQVFLNWNQRDAFCVRVIGLAQSVLSPETAKIFCEGLYYVVEENRKISPQAEALKLAGGESFYRESRESCSGLGGKYLCGATVFAAYGVVARRAGLLPPPLEKLCQAKTAGFWNITRQLLQHPDQPFADRKSSGCVIL